MLSLLTSAPGEIHPRNFTGVETTQEALPYICPQLVPTSIYSFPAFWGCILQLSAGAAHRNSKQHCWPLSRWAVQAVCARISASSTKIPPQPPRSSKWHWVLPICCKTPGLLLSQRTDRQSCWLSSGCLSSLTVRRLKQSFSAQISYPDSKSFSFKNPRNLIMENNITCDWWLWWPAAATWGKK